MIHAPVRPRTLTLAQISLQTITIIDTSINVKASSLANNHESKERKLIASSAPNYLIDNFLSIVSEL
jgi:hypothetical protein